jgi:hypothetical protein
MVVTLTEQVAKDIIRKLMHGEDYRIEVVTLIDAEFLQFTMNFFKKIAEAKSKNEKIDVDWYKKEFLSKNLPAKEIAINSGLNMKTIHNMFNSSTKEITIDAANKHYDLLAESIKNLVDAESNLQVALTIKFDKISANLDLNESLIVINSLAVKRAELRGGLWSTAGKRVEKPLMQTLCKLYGVDQKNYAIKIKGGDIEEDTDFNREIDFYLLRDKNQYKCEVKLMGRGNPESADAVIARDSKVFVADKLSETNKKQLNSLKVEWVELRDNNGWKKFESVLENLKIPHEEFKGDLNKALDKIFKEIF